MASVPNIIRRLQGWGVFRTWTGRIGVAILLFLAVVAAAGPLAAPYGPTEFVGSPSTPPSSQFLLGTDYIGRDVLSRVLAGGRSFLVMSVLAALLTYVVGVPLGVLAGYRRGASDTLITRSADVLLAFPPILLLLILVATSGPGVVLVVVAVALGDAPIVIRLMRAATLEVSRKAYIDSARIRGESTWTIVVRELLPNISSTLATDAGVRLALCGLAVAGANFLGLGALPPAADWGLMVSENRGGLLANPWAVVVPGLLIALLAVGGSLTADAVARGHGRSPGEAALRDAASMTVAA